MLVECTREISRSLRSTSPADWPQESRRQLHQWQYAISPQDRTQECTTKRIRRRVLPAESLVRTRMAGRGPCSSAPMSSCWS
eukprot:4522678-Prymnesium_polylepis.1